MEYDIESILEKYEDDYNPGPRPMNQGPRNMYAQGQLVQPNADGSRPGYNGDRKTIHLVRETGNPNHSGIYRTTNTKTGSVSYRGQFNRRNEGGFKATPSQPTIKQARIDLDKAMASIPKGKSMIELQKEKGAGNMLNNKKFMTQLEKAFEEVSALEKKGYGNIDKIVKKYEKKFYKKVGTKNIDGSTVIKGTDNEFTKALRSEIREYAKELDIYGVENPNMEKALNDYRRIKNPKKGMMKTIADRYGLNKKTLSSYITNLGQRKYIPIQDPGEYTKAIRDAEKKAIKKFSDSYFERKLSAPKTTGVSFKEAKPDEIVRLQKSHMGDKLTQNVKPSNLGYAAQEINQEILKDFDTELRQINKDLEKLYKNKPKGYLQEMDRLNTRGMDLSAASKGYKKFEGIDPQTGKKFVINYSSAAQELDPTNLLGDDVNLADVGKENKVAVKELKDMSIKNISKTKKQVSLDIEEIKTNLADLGCPKSLQKASGGRIKYSKGTSCRLKGKEFIEKGLKNGFPKNQQGDLARKILGTGKFLKDAVSLRGLFGPAALGFTALAEAGFVSYDMLSSGKSFREAIGDSLFNYVVKGTDYEIDSNEEFMKRLKNIKVGPQGYQRMGDAEIGKMLNFKSVIDDMKRGFDLNNELNAITKNKELIGDNPEDTFSEGAFQLDSDKKEDAIRADIQDYNRTGTPRRVTDYLLSDKAKEGADASALANLYVEQDQLQDAGIGKIYQSRLGDEKRVQRSKKIGYEIEDILNPTKYDENAKYFMGLPKSEQSKLMSYENMLHPFREKFMSKPKSEQSRIMSYGYPRYMEGGIASLNVKK